jgi:hypothetical protein
MHGLAASAWQYTERGLNRFGQHGSWLTTHEVNNLIGEPNTLLLLTFLKANNGPSAKFMISNGLAEGPNARLPMNRKALSQARERLIELSYVHQVRLAGGWNQLPALYRWAWGGKLFIEDGWSDLTTRRRTGLPQSISGVAALDPVKKQKS